jgi:hypothetical protein
MGKLRLGESCGSFKIISNYFDQCLSARINTTFIKNHSDCRTPVAHTVIPATQEAEIRRIVIQSQSRQIVLETLS